MPQTCSSHSLWMGQHEKPWEKREVLCTRWSEYGKGALSWGYWRKKIAREKKEKRTLNIKQNIIWH